MFLNLDESAIFPAAGEISADIGHNFPSRMVQA
jgi:hypothetical protein